MAAPPPCSLLLHTTLASQNRYVELQTSVCSENGDSGLNANHRLAIAVSGGPDSIALCVLLLTVDWKSGNSRNGRSKPIYGPLAIVIDHGLRTESAEEADIVRYRVLDMVASCEWVDGKPKLGHLQEAVRNKRYETLQKICIEQQIGVLLIAHHADDQNCLSVAGCYLCPAPGSKGTRVLVCCSADSSLHPLNSSSQNCYVSTELEQIALIIEESTEKFMSDTSSVPFLDATSSEAVLVEASGGPKEGQQGA